MVPALLIVVIHSSPAQPPLPDMPAVLDPIARKPINGSATILLPAANLSGSAGIAKAHPKDVNTCCDPLCP
jgi:hypothetical protein